MISRDRYRSNAESQLPYTTTWKKKRRRPQVESPVTITTEILTHSDTQTLTTTHAHSDTQTLTTHTHSDTVLHE